MFTRALRKLFSRNIQSVGNETRRRYRPKLDALEDRVVPSTLTVDDDLQQRPNADFTSIQAAVNAAQPGDTIKVYAGLYNETVTVNKTLELEGAGPEAHKRTGNPNKEAVVQSDTIFGIFNLEANDIELEGFTIQGNDQGPGVYTLSDFSGYEIEDNLIQNNVFGLYMHSSGDDESVVRDNLFADNTVLGSANGNGIYSDQGANNIVIRQNIFTGHFNAAMLFAGDAGTQSDITVRNNLLVFDSTIAFFNTDGLEITHNLSLRPDGSGIFLGGGVSNAEVSHNAVVDGTSNGIVVRTTPDFGVFGAVFNVKVHNNMFLNNAGTGILVSDTSGHTISDNHVRGSGVDGIRLTNASNNVVSKNHVDKNGRDGIRVEGTSSGNQISKNHMNKNLEHDAHDDTFGTGTAGTANVWKKNSGKTQNRPGLFKN